jgi:hypothetical protein
MKRPFRSSIAVACASLALVAASADCAGRTTIDGRTCPCTDGYRCCDTVDLCVANGDACPSGVISSAATIQRVCSADHGPALGPPRTAEAFGHFLARRWFACRYEPGSVSSLVSHEGIEFGADGTWGFLRPMAAGYERSTAPADIGTYQVWNDTLLFVVPTTDTTQGHDLRLTWTETKGGVQGSLTLYFEFEYSPLRFKTTNGIELWFVAEGGDGTELIGVEGPSCESDHTLCQPGSNCVSEHNAEMCSRPVSNLPIGQGCDNRMTRTCMPQLICSSETRRCTSPAP